MTLPTQNGKDAPFNEFKLHYSLCTIFRTRNINHDLIEKRETVPVLQQKLSHLEEALAMRECEGLEKALVIKQVTQITEDSMTKANYLKETYKDHTSSLCTLRRELYHMSYRIDGMIAETAIAVTQADLAEKRYFSCF